MDKSQTSLYRSTKNRTALSQDKLKSSLKRYKYASSLKSDDSGESSYHQSYDQKLPLTSVALLDPIIGAFTDDRSGVNEDIRQICTIGMWTAGTNAVYRCCFIQPELSTATCTFSSAYVDVVRDAISTVASRLPGAPTCALSSKGNTKRQLLGRMSPYVADELSFDVTWTFALLTGSRFIMLRTHAEHGASVLTFTQDSMSIMKDFFPSYSTCVLDMKNSSYKITAQPPAAMDMNEPNKNTCMIVSFNGSFKLQGKPEAMGMICRSFKAALIQVLKSRSHSAFLRSLTSLDEP